MFLQFCTGITLSFFGIYCFCGLNPNWVLGIPAQLISAFLLVRSFPKFFPVEIASKKKVKKIHHPSTKKENAGISFQWIGPMIGMAVAVYLFRVGKLEEGWILTLLSIPWAGWLQKHYGFPISSPTEFRLNETYILIFILFIAAILRFSLVWTNLTGFQADEANNLLDESSVAFGGALVHNSPFITGWGATPTMPDFIVGAFFKLFGASVWLARLISALASLFALWFFYKWCRFRLGNLASLCAVYLMAVSWWFLYLSLSPFHNAILIMTETVSFYFLEKGILEGKRMDFWWAGIFSALCVMNYVPGRAIPLIMALMILGYAIFQGRVFISIFWKPLSLSLIAFFWLVTPFFINLLTIQDKYNDSFNFWHRVRPGWIFQEAERTGGYFFLVKSYFWTLSSFWCSGPPHPGCPIGFDNRFSTGDPFLDPIAGAAALLGLGICLFNPKQKWTWILVPGWFLSLSANALSIQSSPAEVNYIHPIRLSVIIPFLYLSAGWGLEWLFYSFKTMNVGKGFFWSLCIATLLVFSLGLNGPVIWHDFSKDPGDQGLRGFNIVRGAELLNSHYPQDHLLGGSSILSPGVYFLTRGHSKFEKFDDDPEIPIRYKASRNVLLVFEPWRVSDPAKNKIRDTYPKAVWTDVKDPWDRTYATTVEIPLKEIQEAQRGLSLREELP